MSFSRPAAVSALVLVPIVIVGGVTFGAIKCSEIGEAKWAALKAWSRPRKGEGKHKRKNSDPSSETRSWECSGKLENGRSSWEEDVAARC